MFLRLLLLFTVVPLVELFLLIRIGESIGAPATVALVILTGVLGAWLARLQGLAVLRRIQEHFAAGRMPTEPLIDGLLLLLAGAVLITPGLITDAVGFFLLVPAGRAAVRRLIGRALQRRIQGDEVVIDAQWRQEDE